jgi:tetratricopeptide (TPR) repeat protein
MFTIRTEGMLKLGYNVVILLTTTTNGSAAYGALGQWELAEADAKECVQCNPGFAKGYHRLANAQKQLGKTDEAIATLKAAQTISPESANVPGIKKLMHELSKEKPGGAGQGGRPLPAGVAKELQELQPKFYGIQREVEQVSTSQRLLSC